MTEFKRNPETGDYNYPPVTLPSRFNPGQQLRIVRTSNPVIYLYSIDGQGGPKIAYVISPPTSPYFNGEKFPIYENNLELDV